MVREQHKGYFEARGYLRSAKAIFFEQLITQLVVRKATDADIILLGDFNENVYSGRIAKRLEQLDLNFSEQCLGCTGMHIPPTFRDGIMPIDSVYATAGIECVNAYILPHKGGI
jgi:endonuclease/exonuclease/phosphatase (EEP) superfamily protein YafD